MKRRAFYPILAFALLGACQSPPAAPSWTAADQKAVADTVVQTLHAYYGAVRATGLEAEFAYLDSSADFFWAPPGYASAIGYDSVRVAVQRNARRFTHIDNRWDSLAVHPLSRMHASYTGRFTSRMTDTAGQTAEYRLLETGVMVRRPDGWKLQSGQTALLQ